MCAAPQIEQMMGACAAPSMSVGCAMASAPQPSTPALPSFEDFISYQSSEGFWEANSKSKLYQFLNESDKKNLNTVINNNSQWENLILTIFALQVLEKAFSNQKSQWEMISKKAKKWIRQNTELSLQNNMEKQIKTFSVKTSSNEVSDMEARLAELMAL